MFVCHISISLLAGVLAIVLTDATGEHQSLPEHSAAAQLAPFGGHHKHAQRPNSCGRIVTFRRPNLMAISLGLNALKSGP
jgi:hypothetical protein